MHLGIALEALRESNFMYLAIAIDRTLEGPQTIEHLWYIFRCRLHGSTEPSQTHVNWVRRKLCQCL